MPTDLPDGYQPAAPPPFDHRAAAERIVQAESAHASPDARSVPFLLNGILHALLAEPAKQEPRATYGGVLVLLILCATVVACVWLVAG